MAVIGFDQANEYSSSLESGSSSFDLSVILLSIPRFSPILALGIRAPHAMIDQIMTLKEVAAYLKLAEKTAYKLAADGKLPGFKVGGRWRFRQEDIESWIEEKKKEQGERINRWAPLRLSRQSHN